jgi:hypothetical protein
VPLICIGIPFHVVARLLRAGLGVSLQGGRVEGYRPGFRTRPNFWLRRFNAASTSTTDRVYAVQAKYGGRAVARVPRRSTGDRHLHLQMEGTSSNAKPAESSTQLTLCTRSLCR